MTSYGAVTNTYYALKDHLGSVLALTDGAGNIVESYRYDAWGGTSVYAANGSALTASAVGNRYCWQGREYSFKTGLYYFRARWADPVTGRWLSPDPIGIAGGLNQYVFCGNNPLNFRDPRGFCKDGEGFISMYQSEFNRDPYNANYILDDFLGRSSIDIGEGPPGLYSLGGRKRSASEMGNIAAGQVLFHAWGTMAFPAFAIAETQDAWEKFRNNQSGCILPNAWGSFSRNAIGVGREVTQHPVRALWNMTGGGVYNTLRCVGSAIAYVLGGGR